MDANWSGEPGMRQMHHKHDDGDLDDDNGRVRPRALTNSVDQKRRHCRDKEKRRKIQCDRVAGNPYWLEIRFKLDAATR
jgi:hypothetical protein